MGTGKTTVGSLLARRLGRPFIDLDQQVELHTGEPIADTFSRGGEEAFRRIERSALTAVIEQNDGPVVALGGGTLLDPNLRNQVRNAGPLLTLDAPLSTIEARLTGDQSRPLLQERSLEDICAERATAYTDVDCVVDAGIDEPELVAEAIERVLSLRGVS